VTATTNQITDADWWKRGQVSS